MGGDRVLELAGARLVEELGRQPRRLRVLLQERVEEARARAVLVVAGELAGPSSFSARSRIGWPAVAPMKALLIQPSGFSGAVKKSWSSITSSSGR